MIVFWCVAGLMMLPCLGATLVVARRFRPRPGPAPADDSGLSVVVPV